jgi:hypothetical protein
LINRKATELIISARMELIILEEVVQLPELRDRTIRTNAIKLFELPLELEENDKPYFNTSPIEDW